VCVRDSEYVWVVRIFVRALCSCSGRPSYPLHKVSFRFIGIVSYILVFIRVYI